MPTNFVDAETIIRGYYTFIEFVQEQMLKHPWLNQSYTPFFSFTPDKLYGITRAFSEEPQELEVDGIKLIYAWILASQILSLVSYLELTDESAELLAKTLGPLADRNGDDEVTKVWVKEVNKTWRKFAESTYNLIDTLLVADMEKEQTPKILLPGD
ncbi:MAG TPA: hypothetical protein VKR58_06165 [Aquella sp.]|nr:hypothetical protein [Aquella sp.]